MTPPRSDQYVRVRIHRGEIEATRTPGGALEVPWQEVRRLTGQDLTAPGHEVTSRQDDRVRELRVCLAEMGTLYARAQRLAAELED